MATGTGLLDAHSTPASADERPTRVRTLRCDFHLHTADDRFDRIRHDIFALIDAAAARGYDFLAVTNHLGVTRRADADDHAAARGITLIPGVELTVEGRHVLCINAPHDLDPMKVGSFADLRAIRNPSSLLIPAHPYFPGPTHFGRALLDHADLWDAIELCHFYTPRLDFNRRARADAATLGLPLLATSDAHSLAHLGSSFSEITAVPTAAGIVDAIRGGRLTPRSTPRSVLKLLHLAYLTWRAGGTEPTPPGHGRRGT